MIAVNIMNIEASLPEDAPVADALKLVESSGAAAVLKPGGEVMGLVTPAALCALFSARGLDASALATVTVREAMDEGFSAVTPETGFNALRRVLDSPGQGGAVVVVDDGRRFLGLITHKDMLRRVWEYAEKRRAQKG